MIRKVTEKDFPRIYELGNYYMKIMKIYII